MQVVKSHDYMNFVLDWQNKNQPASPDLNSRISLSLTPPPPPPIHSTHYNSPPPQWDIHNDTFSAYMSPILSFNETGLKNKLWLKIK